MSFVAYKKNILRGLFFWLGLGHLQCFEAALGQNDDTHLKKPLSPMDFYLESVTALPNNACLQNLFRFGYIHSVLIMAMAHKLSENKKLSDKDIKELRDAKRIFEQALKPFSSGYPIANAMFGTTSLWQDMEEQRRTYQRMP